MPPHSVARSSDEIRRKRKETGINLFWHQKGNHTSIYFKEFLLFVFPARYASRKASDFSPFVAKKAGGEMPSKKETPS